MYKYFFILLIFVTVQTFQAQEHVFTKQDTLRGSITPERVWWDLTYYHLNVSVDPSTKSITGKNAIHYKVLESNTVLQIDLQAPLTITKITQDDIPLEVSNDGNAHFI